MAQASEKRDNTAVHTGAFPGYSIKSIADAKKFYFETLGIDGAEQPEGLELKPDDGFSVFLYEKPDHEPATFTVLNLMVDDVEKAVDELTARGIKFESYTGAIATDEKGIHWGAKDGNGPNIAWFQDPSGNIVSIIES